MIIKDFVDLSDMQGNLQEILDLCAAIAENQLFLDKDAAATFYFTLATKLGSAPMDGTAELAACLIDCIDMKNDESIRIGLLGLETLTEIFYHNDTYAEHVVPFLEECADTEEFGERAQFLLDNFFQKEE